MARFEAHLTFDKEHARIVEDVADTSGEWVFSVIAGCPILGKGTYCYLTGYDTDAAKMLVRLRATANYAGARGAAPLRSKIERIVYDTKTDVDEVTYSMTGPGVSGDGERGPGTGSQDFRR